MVKKIILIKNQKIWHDRTLTSWEDYMDLREYLFRFRITATAFSKKVECSRNYISMIQRGEAIPSNRLARDIVAQTGGIVTMEDLTKDRK